MGLRERFRLEEVEGDSLLYVAPLSLHERLESEDAEDDDSNEEDSEEQEEQEEAVS